MTRHWSSTQCPSILFLTLPHPPCGSESGVFALFVSFVGDAPNNTPFTRMGNIAWLISFQSFNICFVNVILSAISSFFLYPVLFQSVLKHTDPQHSAGPLPTNVELVHCPAGYYVVPIMLSMIRKDDKISPRWASFLHVPVMSVTAFKTQPTRVKEAILDHNTSHLNKFGVEPKMWHYRKEFHEQFVDKLAE